MRSLVEEHAHAVVGELVAEAVLVRVVDPLGHPQKGLGPRQTGRVPAGCKKKKKKGGGLKKKKMTLRRRVITQAEAVAVSNWRPTCWHARQAAAEHFHS